MKRDGLIILSFAVAVLWLFAPVLSNNMVLYGTDTVSHDYLMFAFGWDAVKESARLPLWLPYLFLGLPFIGSYSFVPFYPTSLLGYFVNLPLSFNLQYPLNIFLLALFSYLMLRRFDFQPLVSWSGGLLIMGFGHVTTLCYPGHLQKVEAIVWFPWVVAFLQQGMKERRIAPFAVAGIGLAMQALAGHLQILYYTVLFSLLLVLWHLITVGRGSIARRQLVLAAVGLLLALLVMLLLSAVHLLPALEMGAESNRGKTLSYGEAAMGSYPPSELLEYVVPRFAGDSTMKGHRQYFGWWKERLVSDYVGLGAFILSLIGLVYSRRKERYFFLFVSLFTLALALGKHSPLYRLFYYAFPLFSHFRSPATIMFLTTFSFLLLIASGLEALVRDKGRIGFTRLIPLILAPIGLTVLVSLVYRWYVFGETAEAGDFLLSGLRHTLIWGCVLAAPCMVLLYVSPRNGLLVIMLTGILFFDAAINTRIFITPTKAVTYHRYLYGNSGDSALREFSPPVRFLEMGNELTNRAMMQRLGSPHGYHPVVYERFYELIVTLGFYHPSVPPLFYQRFLVVKGPEETPPPNFKLLRYAPEFRLYENRKPLQYLYFPAELRKAEAAEILRAVASQDFDPYQLSYAEADFPFSQLTQATGLQYRVLHYAENEVVVEAAARYPGWVVMAEPFVPGWQAQLDGHPLQLYRANYHFRLFSLPPGTHLLRFCYRPLSFQLGVFFTGMALLGLITLALIYRRRVHG